MKFFRRKPASPKVGPGHHNSRTHYRVLPKKKHAITARIMLAGDHSQAAELFDLSAGGAGLALSSEDDPNYQVDDELALVFSSFRASHDIEVDCCVANRISGDWGTRYGVRFLNLEQFFETLDQHWFQCFNRRRIARALPALDHRIPLVFGGAGGTLSARVINISPEGLAAVATGDMADLLDTIAHVGVLVDAHIKVLKGADPIPVGLQVRHRRPTPAGLAIGVSFEVQEGKQREKQLAALAAFTRERLKEVALWNEAEES